MQRENSGAHGLRWGVIIGLVYCALLAIRFSVGARNAALFGLLTFVGFIVTTALLFFCGYNFRKKNGGTMEMKDGFKTMFIAVLVFEAFFSVFVVVYLKYIDPSFFNKFRDSTESVLAAIKQPQADMDKILDGIDKWAADSKRLNVFDILRTYLTNVAVTGLFALLFAFILKRKAPPFQSPDINREVA